jgi:hypothetical protein
MSTTGDAGPSQGEDPWAQRVRGGPVLLHPADEDGGAADRHLLGEAADVGLRPQLVEAGGAVVQDVGGDVQQRRPGAGGQAQRRVQGARWAAVPPGAGVRSGDREPGAVREHVETAVGQDAAGAGAALGPEDDTRTPVGSFPVARHGLWNSVAVVRDACDAVGDDEALP